ncbi:Uncharacterised protein [Salmonella enterica subsp. arizonae]|uniref:Uncharacterized protein n=1 Tax=Salmonella enterica subsp. arizonae TaxID=59203 RepID=A0A379S2G4_SALER|nr:Uncharacterised protein [Salmonella enterica subsp. arizonae]
MPGENQPCGDSVSWAFCPTNIAASGHQTIMRQRVGNELRYFEIKRRTTDQDNKRNVADIARWADLA